MGDSADEPAAPLIQHGLSKCHILRSQMFIFDRPIAAVLAALATSFVFVFVEILLDHAVN
jgi:hypothetical protein